MNKEIFILEQKDFPEKLKNIKKSPKKLYLIGNKKLLFEDSIAIIGSRKNSKYGEESCRKIAKELALRNIIITSGLAIGIDTIAHKVALENNSKTIAVLGSGFDNIFPKENEKLYNDIIENDGLIISEYSPDEKATSEKFPQRNRIISAISIGILVVEARNKSGTGITVRYGIEQKKKIFAIPGNINSKYSEGTNKIIKSGGFLVTDVKDILERYPQFLNKKRKNIVEKSKKIKKEWIKIIKILDNKTINVEEIMQMSDLKDENKIVEILFEMQIEGIIEEIVGEGYRLKIT